MWRLLGVAGERAGSRCDHAREVRAQRGCGDANGVGTPSGTGKGEGSAQPEKGGSRQARMEPVEGRWGGTRSDGPPVSAEAASTPHGPCADPLGKKSRVLPGRVWGIKRCTTAKKRRVCHPDLAECLNFDFAPPQDHRSLDECVGLCEVFALLTGVYMKKVILAAAIAATVFAPAQLAIAAAPAKQYVVVNEEFGVPVFPYDITDRPYQVIGEVKAGVRKATIFSKAPSQEKIYRELWERGEKLGADAVIKAQYGDAHVTALSWGSSSATGVAIKFVDAAAPAAN